MDDSGVAQGSELPNYLVESQTVVNPSGPRAGHQTADEHVEEVDVEKLERQEDLMHLNVNEDPECS